MTKLYTGCEADVAAVNADLEEFASQSAAMTDDQVKAYRADSDARFEKEMAKAVADGFEPFWR